ncbi:hypothetical protein GUJ93_ZPchr0004g38966 [Zizania palustris]|uniref:Pentatricopeptide repeat-containing protein n=1 Tax=Zizania palustris TaxID=103762 RepID=A0A8J5V9J1_ZIZPA|nr:hypothetical protein GUJ93_ZPchr0004g38966 [Zizania palustris]
MAIMEALAEALRLCGSNGALCTAALLVGFASVVFLQSPEHPPPCLTLLRDVASWNKLMFGYFQAGRFLNGIETFVSMQQSGDSLPNTETPSHLVVLRRPVVFLESWVA